MSTEARPTPATEQETRTGVQSLHRALDLLEVVEAHGGHLSLAELAAAVDLAPATVHRLLRTLLERGYVRQRPDRRYALGFRLVPLGTAATSLVAETAVGVLTDLVAELGETANLAVLSGHQAEYVAQVPSTYSMRMFTRVGHRVALHCTGVGKAMLAHAGPALVEQVLAAPLPTPTAYTLGTADALRAALADVRRLGFAVDEQEQELGVRCVAAPVPGAGVAMAISVSGPLTRLTDEVVARAVPALQQAARRLVGDAAGPPSHP